MIIDAIFGVIVALFLGVVMWRTAAAAKRARIDPFYRRRRLTRWAWMYVSAGLIGIFLVAARRESPLSLVGLPVVAVLAWILFRAARKVEVPPQ